MLSKWIDFINIILSNYILKWLKLININNYAINLVENKQIYYNLIYILRSVMLWPRDPYYMISFVIIFNDISLNPSIALIYHLVFNGLTFWYISPLFLLLSYYSFDIYSSTFHLLRSDLLWLDLVGDLGLFLKPYDCESMTGSSYSQPQPWLVACVIAWKRPQFTQNLRPLEPLYG